MKKLLYVGACLLALASVPASAQTGSTDVVVVKVTEAYDYLLLDIARAGVKPERRTFKRRDLLVDGAPAEITRQLIAELYQEGYTLTSAYGGGGIRTGSNINLNTLVFTKHL
jgi:hypothetical protein